MNIYILYSDLFIRAFDFSRVLCSGKFIQSIFFSFYSYILVHSYVEYATKAATNNINDAGRIVFATWTRFSHLSLQT